MELTRVRLDGVAEIPVEHVECATRVHAAEHGWEIPQLTDVDMRRTRAWDESPCLLLIAFDEPAVGARHIECRPHIELVPRAAERREVSG